MFFVQQQLPSTIDEFVFLINKSIVLSSGIQKANSVAFLIIITELKTRLSLYWANI